MSDKPEHDEGLAALLKMTLERMHYDRWLETVHGLIKREETIPPEIKEIMLEPDAPYQPLWATGATPRQAVKHVLGLVGAVFVEVAMKRLLGADSSGELEVHVREVHVPDGEEPGPYVKAAAAELEAELGAADVPMAGWNSNDWGEA